jgi:hypothetical protein
MIIIKDVVAEDTGVGEVYAVNGRFTAIFSWERPGQAGKRMIVQKIDALRFRNKMLASVVSANVLQYGESRIFDQLIAISDEVNF